MVRRVDSWSGIAFQPEVENRLLMHTHGKSFNPGDMYRILTAYGPCIEKTLTWLANMSVMGERILIKSAFFQRRFDDRRINSRQVDDRSSLAVRLDQPVVVMRV